MPLTPGAPVALNTTKTNDMGPDGFTWAPAAPLLIDPFGCLIVLVEDNGGGHAFTYSNDSGATWRYRFVGTGALVAAAEGQLFARASVFV